MRCGFDMGDSMLIVRFLVCLPFVIIGETLRNIGFWIAPVKTIANGGLYQSELGGYYVNGFGEKVRMLDDVNQAEAVMAFRMNRQCERYRSAVEEETAVRDAKAGEAKSLCP